MRLLSVSDVILLHKKLIEQTGGSPGIRDIGLIESAVKRPLATFDGRSLYSTPAFMIAALTYSLVRNHALVDGNKRIGIAAIRVSYEIHTRGVSNAWICAC